MRSTESKEVEALYKRGVRFERFGELNAAEEELSKVLKLDPPFSPAWDLIGVVYQRAGKIDRARECFQEAARLDPEWTDPLEHLGLMEVSLKRYLAASNALKLYMDLGGRTVETLVALTRTAMELEDCILVVDVAITVLAVDVSLAEIWMLRGLCEVGLFYLKEAQESLETAVQLSPKLVPALNALGHLHYEAEEYEEAVSCYKRSLAQRGKQPPIHYRYGNALWFLGRWQEALPELKTYTELVLDDPKGWNNLGVVYREKGEVKRAIECLRKALHLDPTLESARSNLDVGTKHFEK